MPRRRRKPRRPLRIEGDIAYVPLTQGYTAIIDADQAWRVGRWLWSVRRSAKSRAVYAQANMRGKPHQLHRYIMRCRKGLVVDHLNGDGLDNRRANLRVCTQRENQRNRYYHRDPSLAPKPKSGFVGITKLGFSRYQATVVHNGAALNIARGCDPEELSVIREWYVEMLQRRPRSVTERVEWAKEILEKPSVTLKAANYLVAKILAEPAARARAA